MVRKYLVGGNWKSNGTLASITELCNDVLNATTIDFSKVQCVVAPVFVHIPHAKALLKPEIEISAQNASLTAEGAFTGEVTVNQIKDLGINWVILGHSERRCIFGETDEIVGDKVNRALAAGLSVMACFGENLQERESGVTLEVVARQLNALKDKVTDWSRVALAYEPVWAIGTGKVASPEQAQEVHAMVRNWLREQVNAEVADATRVMYGGSVTDANCAELIALQDVDGFLVGGAALKPAFKTILESCASA